MRAIAALAAAPGGGCGGAGAIVIWAAAAAGRARAASTPMRTRMEGSGVWPGSMPPAVRRVAMRGQAIGERGDVAIEPP